MAVIACRVMLSVGTRPAGKHCTPHTGDDLRDNGVAVDCDDDTDGSRYWGEVIGEERAYDGRDTGRPLSSPVDRPSMTGGRSA